MRRFTAAAMLLLSTAVLTGCGFSVQDAVNAPVASAHVQGRVYGGQQPVANSTVTVWRVGENGYGSAAQQLAQTTSDAYGNFSIPAGTYTCPSATTQVYITARGGNATPGAANPYIEMAAGLGNCSAAQNQTVDINEVTTAATAFALAQFFDSSLAAAADSFGAPANGLVSLANSNVGTVPALVDLPSGTARLSNTSVRTEAAKLYSIANTLAACINDSTPFNVCSMLMQQTTPPGGTTAPSDTLQAAVQMARYPYQNVTSLYNLAPPTSPFVGLSGVPNDWTLALAYISAPTFGLSIANINSLVMSASIDIDSSGNIWFPTTVPGNAGIGSFNQASRAFAGPFVPHAPQPQLIQPGYVSISPTGVAWTTDLASNVLSSFDTTNPAVNNFSEAFPGNVVLGPVAVTGTNTVLFSGMDASSNVYLNAYAGNTNQPHVSTFLQTPTAMAWPADGDVYAVTGFGAQSTAPCMGEYQVYNSTANTYTRESEVLTTNPGCNPGGVATALGATDGIFTSVTDNAACSATPPGCFTPAVGLSSPEGIATDGRGNEWVADFTGGVSTFGAYASGANSYPETSDRTYKHDSSNGATLTFPFAIAVDGSGNVWVANAGCVGTGCTPGSFVLTQIVGAAAPTITPLSLQGTSAGSMPQSVQAGTAAHVRGGFARQNRSGAPTPSL